MNLKFVFLLAFASTVGSAVVKNMTTYDMTYVLENDGMPLFVNTTFRMDVTKNAFLPNQTENITMSTAVGTHMQAPCRYAPGKMCISDIPTDKLRGHVVIMDFLNQNPDVPISGSQVSEWQKKNGAIPKNAIVIINTGWGAKWSNASLYLGNASALNSTNMHYPGLNIESADVLVKMGISGIGIDTSSLDLGQNASTYAAHKVFADADIYAILNIAGISSISQRDPKKLTGYVMPLNMRNASAAPCRMFVVNNGVGDLSNSAVSVFIALCLSLVSYLR